MLRMDLTLPENSSKLGLRSRQFLAMIVGLFFLVGFYSSIAATRCDVESSEWAEREAFVEKPWLDAESSWISSPPLDKGFNGPIGPVTYTEDVAGILAKRCVSCHQPGQIGPFSLLTYDQAVSHSAMIREVIDSGQMPPWHADPRHGHFANDRRLNSRERAVLVAWIDRGTPLGNLTKALPQVKRSGTWSIGEPDVVLQMAESFQVPAEGVVPYQYFRVPTHFKEDKWVQAIEARPGNRGVVHHFIVRVDVPGADYHHHGQQPYLAGYAPGDIPSIYTPGIARRIPAGADLIFAVHYTPNGSPTTDRSSVGLIFAKEPAEHEAVTAGISQEKFLIPAGAENVPVRSHFEFQSDAHLLSLQPHMHLRGKAFRYLATYPNGRSEILLSIPAYDFSWQSIYRLEMPKAMPAGTRIDCLAVFDNSAKNPNNPDPSKPVRWGEQSSDEMMIGFIDYFIDRPSARNILARRSRLAKSGFRRRSPRKARK